MIAATPSILECIGRGVFNSKSLSGGGIGFLVDQHSALPRYVATALGYGIPTAQSLRNEFKNRFKKQKETQSHDLYFYYQLRDSRRSRTANQPQLMMVRAAVGPAQ
jgi:hypothetical protein